MRRARDLTGRRFGALIVLAFAGRTASRNARWRCRCECGGESTVTDTDLVTGETTSCRPCAWKARTIDLSGRRFGMLVVISRGENHPSGVPRWLCRCDCGTELLVRGAMLRRGTSRSCGCTHWKHGHRRALDTSPTYESWQAMWERCARPKHPAYARYGGRSIKVCERWRDFAAFLADMGERPPEKTLDRHPNPNGDYEPGNCRWATLEEQAVNRDGVLRLSHSGETLPVLEWARRLRMDPCSLRGRLRAGWSVERAVTTPPARRRPHSREEEGAAP